jgi:dTDP-4-dehydrorhamnose reductase
MKKVLVLGATGMLGHAVAKLLSEESGFEIIQSSRTKQPSYQKFDVEADNISEFINTMKPDWIINCIGIIKPHIKEESANSVFRAIQVNSIFPYLLSSASNKPIIQIATDCTFSGESGNYVETDLHDATDVYGKSKSLGEIKSENMKHLRVSIIGPENGRSTSLLEWFRSQSIDAEVRGFKDHLWNGITTYHFGKIAMGIIQNDFTEFEKTHVVPANVVTKSDLLNIFGEAYNRSDIKVVEANSSKTINRTLSTTNPELNTRIWEMAGYQVIPTIREMVNEQALTV